MKKKSMDDKKNAPEYYLKEHERRIIDWEKRVKEIHGQHNTLLKNIKDNLPELEKMMGKVSNHWDYEDRVYRYYHGSFKVYYLQETTMAIVDLLKKIAPNKEPLNADFMEILEEGSQQVWVPQHNREWGKRRPIVEAFFHAKFFLEMAIKYGKELEEAPNSLPSGWAALLYLYNIR